MFVLTEETVKMREFWIEQLSGEKPSNMLLPDELRTSNTRQNQIGLVETNAVDDTFESLKKYCKESDFLWYCFLFAGLNVCLYKYSGYQDFVIGSPHQGEMSRSESILPIRSKMDAEMSFKEWVLQVRERLAAAYEYQQFPLDSLINELGISVEGETNSLINFVASFEGLHLPFSSEINEQTIQILFRRSGGKLGIKLQYPSEYYTEDSIKRFVHAFKHILQLAVRHINKPIKELSICPPEEEHIILNEFNLQLSKAKEKMTIAGFFEQQMANHVDKVALIDEDRQMTYSDLDHQSNKLAAVLQKNWNIKPNEFVAVYMNRRIDYIVSILAVLKAGGAYVPLDIDYPNDRIQYILKDCKAKLLLTDQGSENLTTDSIPILQVSALLEKEEQHLDISYSTKSEDLAYLLYTSGTTGFPKGTLIEQRNVLNLVVKPDYLTFNSQTCMLQASSVVFDLSTLEIWGTLLNGGTLVLVDKQTLIEPMKLESAIQKYKVNSAILTTALFHHVASHRHEIFKELNQILTGGETLSAVLADKALQMNPDLKLVNAYGPTECTVLTTAYDVKIGDKGNIPIGNPVKGTNVKIIGVDGQIQPIGVLGELCIAGKGVGRGYLNKPDTTCERFIKDKDQEHLMLYKTGDLARWREDGSIEFLGRKDRQVKLRGYRIELGEIENCLLNHKDILETVVLPIEVNMEQILCAYIVQTAEVDADVYEVQMYLKQNLPSYMVPAVFVPIHRIPLTVSGKLDVAKLPVPTDLHFGIQQEKTDRLPHSEEEKKIASIWTEILGIKQISLDHNFFELGGHSLKLILLAEQLQQAGYPVNTMDLYKYPTIASFLENQWKQRN
ncbi:non-ribosomal peptide synthetase [Metabacillus halosaccharovorans]|uniref:non-ribosomal peptide synthetase n=1 Tax=Metabacillus halosaccharovorans TaxID=930124 RepID=UPI00203C9E05|nr:non-ribosomal peptide synthetase [Metabacillus halosaccharovorans]MCM3439301.1 amino acid adenylation domain-containing protein [Metabacillus halosaccharovorans]